MLFVTPDAYFEKLFFVSLKRWLTPIDFFLASAKYLKILCVHRYRSWCCINRYVFLATDVPASAGAYVFADITSKMLASLLGAGAYVVADITSKLLASLLVLAQADITFKLLTSLLVLAHMLLLTLLLSCWLPC
jgi:hypothetical protein